MWSNSSDVRIKKHLSVNSSLAGGHPVTCLPHALLSQHARLNNSEYFEKSELLLCAACDKKAFLENLRP